jgi:hypothetical protein
MTAPNERARPTKKQIVGLGPVTAADAVHIARAARDDKADFGTLTFDYGIDRDRRTMNQLADVGDCKIGFANTIDHADDGVVWSGKTLCVLDLPGLRIESDEIGERAADIDSKKNQVDGPPGQ